MNESQTINKIEMRKGQTNHKKQQQQQLKKHDKNKLKKQQQAAPHVHRLLCVPPASP
jgi:hypothetical protein